MNHKLKISRPQRKRQHKRQYPFMAIVAVCLLSFAFCLVALRHARAQSATLAIHDLQGSAATSARVGQVITTSGIVTAIKSNGFFLQAADADIDANDDTSEAIFVFTSEAPPAELVAVGNAVTVSGTVAEFRPSSDPQSPTLTELAASPTITFVSAGNELPAPVKIKAEDTTVNNLNNLEKFEAMRVRVDSLSVVAPTGGSVNEANATATSNGIFYGVVTGVARPFREPGIQVPNALPTGAPSGIPRFDANPERLRVDSDAQSGATKIEVTTGAMLANLVGVLDYGSRVYTILPDPATPPEISGNLSAVPVPQRNVDEFTIASFNMQRFFDTENDESVSDVVLTPEAFNNRLSKAAKAIINVMRLPEIIGVQEVENLATLQTLANKLNRDASANFTLPSPQYEAFMFEGNDPAGIDVGFLVRTSSVAVLNVSQAGRDATYINPNNGQAAQLNDRPPLVLRAVYLNTGGLPLAFTVIVNHLRSLTDIADATDGQRVRAKRKAQAEFLANLIQTRQAANPAERIIVIGDFNSFQFNDGYVDVMGTIKGAPAPPTTVTLASNDLVNPDLTNLVDLTQNDQPYSYVFDGNAQALDHVLVSATMLPYFSRLHYGRSNADFPESLRDDATRPERLSDHDMPVAYFKINPNANDFTISKRASVDTVSTGQEVSYFITVTNESSTTANNVSITDLLPFGTVFKSATASLGTVQTPAVGAQGTVRCSVGTLNAHSSASLVVSVTVTFTSVNPLRFPITNSALATAVLNGQVRQVLTSATVTWVPPEMFISGATIEGKALKVTGFGFQTGAKIEVNGQTQKTANDETNPTTLLIAKKAGKFIASGTTVQLTVVNPNGTRSPQFSFTRP